MDRMIIGFVTLGLEFNGDTIKNKGLGGSETAMICMAREFAKLGHRVAVFCQCDAPGNYDGVDYYSVQNFAAINALTKWDVMIASRWPEFLTKPIQAGLRVLWLHDLITDQARLMTQTWQTDLAILLSDYHIQNYTETTDGTDPRKTKVPWLKDILWKSSNGVDIEMINEIRERTPKVPGKVIFTSRPERGLDYLSIFILPELLKEFPDLKLHYCNYSLGNMQVPQSVKISHAAVAQQQKKYPHNMINAGHLTKEKLYEEMCSAELLLYPTNFGEISCITAMEAQACGTPIISTNDFALSETVENGTGGWLIDGRPTDDTYAAKFIRKTLEMLRDKSLRDKMGKAGVDFVKRRGYTWAAVAKSWETKFNRIMEDRYTNNREAVIKTLVRNHDLCLAQKMLAEDDYEDAVVNEKILGVLCPTVILEPQEIVDHFRTTQLPLYKDLIHFMAALSVNPKSLWDYSCGPTAFGVVYAKATRDTQVYCLDENKDVLAAVANTASGEKVGLESRVRTLETNSLLECQAPAPDAIYLGNYLDEVEEPWLVLQDAIARVKPDGYIIFTTRSGPGEDRLWNFEQQDFYEMFGVGFKGHLTFKGTGITSHGEVQGHWLGILPVAKNKDLQVLPLLPGRRRRTTRPYQSLAVCMIAKDEEDWITLCLKQVYEIADKIVIALDDRTTDSTRELVEALDSEGKVEIRDVTFEDFAQVRNESIKDLKEDWILWIDADERMTDPMKIRRYLEASLHEGFSLKQQHLMLDVHGTYDVPIRLLKNRRNYQFVGCIHEHCENVDKALVEKNGYDNPIEPTILIPDCSLAHYGYLDEKQRRSKCSNRNMELLQKDIEIYGKNGRRMSWVLAIRDYNNIVKWSVNPNQEGIRNIAHGSREHRLLEASIKTFLEHFPTEESRYYQVAFPMYQEALALLSQSGLPFENRKTPPFCTAFALSGAIGKDATRDMTPTNRWFIDSIDYSEFAGKQHSELLQNLGIIPSAPFPESKVQYSYSEDLPQLLSVGVGAIDEKTGVFQR